MVEAISRQASAEPNGQFDTLAICSNTSGPIICIFGPPISTGVAYAFMARAKQIAPAAIRPGMARGKTTWAMVRAGEYPSDCAASSRLLGIESMTLCIVMMAYGSSTETRPMTTAVGV